MSLQDIYKNAGVVMKPAAMKNGKLYSQQPHSGAGDFNFSRADGVQTRINKHGLIETVANNEPRLSYDLVDGKVSDCPHLLLEPSRTNKLPYSLDYDNNTYYQKSNSTATSESGISPDGANTAYELKDTDDTGNTSHYIEQASGYRAVIDYDAIKTASVFVKSGTKKQVQIRLANGTGSFSYIMGNFDLETETILTGASANASDISYDLQNYGNGWYRCIVSGSWDSSNVTQSILQVFTADLSLTSLPNMHNYQGDGTGTLFVWGQMIEEGSYPTSYIPTSGSTEQRQADICNGSGNSETFNDSEGVLFAEIAFTKEPVSGFVTISDGTDDERITIYRVGSVYPNKILGQVRQGNVARVSFSFDTNSTDVQNKIALKYKANDSALWVNGVEVATDTSNTLIPINLRNLEFSEGDGGNPFYGKVKELTVINEALTDEQLQLLTTP